MSYFAYYSTKIKGLYTNEKYVCKPNTLSSEPNFTFLIYTSEFSHF